MIWVIFYASGALHVVSDYPWIHKADSTVIARTAKVNVLVVIKKPLSVILMVVFI